MTGIPEPATGVVWAKMGAGVVMIMLLSQATTLQHWSVGSGFRWHWGGRLMYVAHLGEGGVILTQLAC